MQLYLELNNPGSGSMSVQRYDAAASALSEGKLIKVMYRGQPRGGFFIENIGKDAVKSGEKGAEWVKASGRGALAVLEDGLVYQATGSTESVRKFTSVPMASMLLTLINEAKARGCFPKLRCEFSASKDSNGDAWSDSSTLSFNVDSSLLDVLGNLVDLGLEFDFKIDWVLGDYVLYAYQTAVGSDRSADVVFRPGLNCEDVSESSETGELKNAYHIAYPGGYTELVDAASAAVYRRREVSFQAGNSLTAGEAQELAAPSLALQKDPKKTITVKLNDGQGPRVFVDYALGDWVGYDDGSGELPTAYRIRGIMLEFDEAKFATVTVDLNSVRMERELQNAILLKKLGKGVSSPSSSPMPAGVAAAIATHNGDALAHATRPLSGGDLAGTLATPVVAKIRGVLVDALTTIADKQVLKYSTSLQKFVAGFIDWLEIENKPSSFTPSAHTHLQSQITDLNAVPEAPVDGNEYVRKNARWQQKATGSTTITVEEVDGIPSVEASVIRFPNGSVTDLGGGMVSVDPGTSGTGEIDINLIRFLS